MPEHSFSIRRGLAARPALRLAVLLAAGIILAREVTLPVLLWYGLFFLSILGGMLFSALPFFPHRSTPGSRPGSDTCLQISVLLLGACLLAETERSDQSQRLHPSGPDYAVRASGWIVTPMNPTRSGYSFVLQTDSILSPDWADVHRREVMVYAGEHLKGLRYDPGSYIRLDGTLERFPGPRNPGENDYGATLGLQGISGILRAEQINLHSAQTAGPFRGFIGAIQDRLYAWIDILHPGEHAAFVKGIILGYRAELPEDLKEAFMVTGTVHILAVSGSNVALIGLIIMVCSGFLRIGRTVRVALTIAGMIFYMLVTGGGPSIIRATVMGIIVVLLAFLPRRGDVMQALGVSACVLLLFDPRNLFDAGFLLSFGSVIWIVKGSPVLESAISRLPEEFRDSLIIRSTLQLCGVSLLAQFGTIPISALFFGQISLISVLANLVVVPLSAVVLLLGVAELALYALTPILALPYAEANGFIIDILLGLVRVAADIPFASINVRLSGIVESVLLYSVFIAAVWYANASVRKLSVAIGLICMNILVWTSAMRPTGQYLEWIAADIGQGDAHLVRTPAGRNIVIDAAPQERTAERTLLPLLEEMGVDDIDWLLLTHPHWDHIAGLGILLDRLPVRTLVITDSVRIREDLKERMEANGTRVRRMRAGDILSADPDVRVYVMHPSSVTPLEGWNNNSLVTMVQFGESRVLFTGDLEDKGEEKLVSRYGRFLHADVLKAGHHGSKTSTSELLLDAVKPFAAVMSVGWRNRFGHPSAETESVLGRRGIEIYKTSEDGASWWRSDGTAWTRVSWRTNE